MIAYFCNNPVIMFPQMKKKKKLHVASIIEDSLYQLTEIKEYKVN